VIGAVVAGLSTALGVLGLLIAARRRRPELAGVLAGIDREVAASPVGAATAVDVGSPARSALRPDRALGVALAPMVRHLWLARRLDADLFVTGRTLESVCAECVLAGGTGLALPTVAWALCAAGGIHLPIDVGGILAVVLGIGGATLPMLALPVDSDRARNAARRALGSFLDLVVLCLASGMGLESALEAAAGIGDQPLSRRLARALAIARDAGQPPWAAFDDLGRRSGIDDLVELAAAISLAGLEGARIRATLTSKAASLRKRELAVAEASANRVTERLFLPGVLLLVGFLVFIGYPAVSRIVTGL